MAEGPKTGRTARDVDALADPDCLRCMRKKLRAVGVVVFFEEPDGDWRLENFQGDKPEEAAEVEFQYMLDCRLPQAVLDAGKAVMLPDMDAVQKMFPKCAALFEGHCAIAAPIRHGRSFGIRLAWREQEDPFTEQDLETLECKGDCPDMNYPE